MTPATSTELTRPSEPFVKNVLWNWLGVAVTLVSGIVLAPFLVRNLGDEGFGVWVLVFGLIEYYWLFDLGLRSATIKYCAHYRATGEPDRINEVINTGLVYCSAVALAQAAGSVLLARHVVWLFRVSPGLRPAFSFLIVAIGLSWALGTIFNMFTACLEGFQLFNLSNRIWISVTAIRTVGTAALLWMGYGLVELGLVVVASQSLGYALNYFHLRCAFPLLRFSRKRATFSMFRQLLEYGIHTFTATVALQLLEQGAPLLIGHFGPAAYVGYFSLPVRVLLYAVGGVARVGGVSSAKTAELAARGDVESIPRLGTYANRYCLTAFLPVAMFLVVYGRELIEVWIRKANFAAMSAPLLPVLVVGTTFSDASQWNSSFILYGLGKHRGCARSLLAEGVLLVSALWFVVPRYGILGAAWAMTILAILNRGLFTPWLLCRQLHLRLGSYLCSIYARPLMTALPILGLAFWLKGVLPGRSLMQLGSAAGLIGVCWFGAAYFTCVAKQHRSTLLSWAAKRVRL